MSNRRNFIKKSILTGAGVLAANQVFSTSKRLKLKFVEPSLPKGTVVLFQGDSITDGNRTRDNDWNHVMGHGYAYLIASRLWFDHPKEELMFYNRGISGNTINDLNNRWQEDALDLKPDIISILVGINDVYGIVKGYLQQSVSEFEVTYKKVLDNTKNSLPESTIVLCEPFILPGGRVKEKPEVWEKETKARSEVVQKLANDYQTLYVPLQQPFIDACELAPANYWIWDGIHPMPAGHELIAREWLKVAKQKFG